MEFEKISAPSLKDLFVKQIQGMILSGELAQGTALPPERELARQMQVRRSSCCGCAFAAAAASRPSAATPGCSTPT
ncbi:MAG TPA: GntR family transcriptional regulator [Candidatus Fournierella excrementigallinarum]|nr:GntR family transcriptional regulator [Candidatus Fournierella excrementigallinarum]